MKDHLVEVAMAEPPERRRNLAREFLQIYVLRLLQEQGASRDLTFLGGTALRLIHRLPRFSEDLDFSVDASNGSDGFELKRVLERLKHALEGAGYQVGVKARLERTVPNAFLRFEGLPQQLGWSSDPRLALTVKIEVDQNPPTGGVTNTTLIQRFYPVALRHHDLPSLFAGKLHALIARPWPKGRDWFDLVWYLTEKQEVEPNLELLENALRQTGRANEDVTRWRELVAKRLEELDWSRIIEDLRPFVERQSDLEQINKERVEALL